MRQILESHPVANLKKELAKVKKSLNYSKLNKKELIDLMMKPNLINNFKHLKMYVKPERKKPIKKEVKKEVKAKPAPKARISDIQKFKNFVLGKNKTGQKIKKLKEEADKEFKKNNFSKKYYELQQQIVNEEKDEELEFYDIQQDFLSSDLPINHKKVYQDLLKQKKDINSDIYKILQSRVKNDDFKSSRIEQELFKTNLNNAKKNKPDEVKKLKEIENLLDKITTDKKPGQALRVRKLINDYKGKFKFDRDILTTYWNLPEGTYRLVEKKMITEDKTKQIKHHQL